MYPDGMSRRDVLREGLSLASVVGFVCATASAWRNRHRIDDLDGIVSHSSRIIAAWRAIESEQQRGALFRDPMALALAGSRAMNQAHNRLKDVDYVLDRAHASDSSGAPGAASALQGRRYRVSLVAIRTLWFDRQLQDALSRDRHPSPLTVDSAVSPPGDAGGAGQPVQVRVQPTGVPTQVVLLGAGMDTRAWRDDLNLPPRTRWFEVDREDVVAAKRAAMTSLGASLEAGEAKCAYPLRGGSYAALVADLGVKGWSSALLAAGFHPDQPTVWIAEGLLMYLQPSTVHVMLREMADVSAPGSVFLSMSVTEEMIERMRAKPKPSALLSKFIFGCPADPTQMFADEGWRIISAITREDMWDSFHIAPELRPVLTRGSTSSIGSPSSLFIVATVISLPLQ